MELTAALKAYAVEKLGVAADASDDVFVAAIKKALDDGTLTQEEYAKLGAKSIDVRRELAGIVAEANKPLVEGLRQMTAVLGQLATGQKAATPAATPAASPPAAPLPPEELEARVAAMVEKAIAGRGNGEQHTPAFANAVMARGAQTLPRVKKAIEQYSHVKSVAICPTFQQTGQRHPKAGQPASLFHRPLELPSQRDFAVIGAVVKFFMHGTAGRGIDPTSRMSEHEKDLVNYALHEMTWSGYVGCPQNGEGDEGHRIERRLMTDFERKALLDDTTSGGSYAVPDVFDEAIILTPVLEGQLFPLVDLVRIPRGSNVDGVGFTDPTWSSGSSEGTAFSVVTTTSLIANKDTAIYPVVAAVELGRDWESDTPIDFGALIVNRLGINLRAWLDEQVALGQAAQREPTGIFRASGTTSVTSASGTATVMALGDVEKLMFGLTKAMREANPAKCVFVMNDAQYRRCRQIPVAATYDLRRIFGMDHAAYTLFDKDVRIQNDIPEGYMGFCNMQYYRMYQRLGMQVQNVVEGQTLALKNTRLLVFRARFGGQPMLGSAFAIMTTGQATG